jgi:hypothetical protein
LLLCNTKLTQIAQVTQLEHFDVCFFNNIISSEEVFWIWHLPFHPVSTKLDKPSQTYFPPHYTPHRSEFGEEFGEGSLEPLTRAAERGSAELTVVASRRSPTPHPLLW